MNNLEGHDGSITSVIFTADGQHVISASYDCTVRRWHLSSGAVETLLSHAGVVHSVCLSPDGSLLASGGRDNTIRFSDLESGTRIEHRYTSNKLLEDDDVDDESGCAGPEAEDEEDEPLPKMTPRASSLLHLSIYKTMPKR